MTRESFLSTIESSLDANTNVTSAQVVSTLNQTVAHLFEMYPVTYTSTDEEVTSIYERLGNISDSFWNSNSSDSAATEEQALDLIRTLVTTVMNSIFARFKIDPLDGDDADVEADTMDELQLKIMDDSAAKFDLVVSIMIPDITAVHSLSLTSFSSSNTHLRPRVLFSF